MENLIFSLNATIPIFLMMLLGMLFRKLGWMDEVFAAKMNKFVFLVPQIIKKKHNPQKTACANKELLTTGSNIFLYIIVLDEEDFSF